MLSFQFTRPVWGATESRKGALAAGCISIYAPRMGRYRMRVLHLILRQYFNLCAPYGALLCSGLSRYDPAGISIYAPHVVVNATIACAISIYAPRMGRYVVIYDIDNKRYISIYAPRMGRYRNSRAVFRSIYSISIYAPRMGRYVDPIQFAMSIASFQFMRPVWGATHVAKDCVCAGKFQFMRPVWGATATGSVIVLMPFYFNLCAPYGALLAHAFEQVVRVLFQFMRPVWGATVLP